jgi:hypothetical protein
MYAKPEYGGEQIEGEEEKEYREKGVGGGKNKQKSKA